MTRAIAVAAVIAFALAVAGAGVARTTSADTLAFTCGSGTPLDPDDDICTIGSGGTGLRRLTRGPEWDELPSWSPDRQWIGFYRRTATGTDQRGNTTYRTDLYIVKARGGKERKLVSNVGGKEERPAWSPDSRRIAFSSFQIGNVGMWMVTTGGRRTRITRDGSDGEPSWSPDGRHIAFTRSDGQGGSFLVVMSPNGARQRALHGPDVSDPTWFPTVSDHAWSPDSRRIAYVASDEAVYIVKADDTGLKKLVRGGFGDVEWAPDGKTILYWDIVFGGPDVLYAAPSSGGRRRLLAADARNGVWSPDGRKIAFIRNHGELYTMRADGTGKRRLAPSIKDISDVDW